VVEQQQEPLPPAQQIVNALCKIADGFKSIATGTSEVAHIISEVHKGWFESRARRRRAMCREGADCAGQARQQRDLNTRTRCAARGAESLARRAVELTAAGFRLLFRSPADWTAGPMRPLAVHHARR
jgi:hypothetical protein